MPAEPETAGWDWIEGRETNEPDPLELELCRAYARCLSGPEGERVAEHLRRTILERRLGPEASDAELRHLEGQRSAVAQILAMAARGRA